jgi:hypothetical protein
MFRLIEPLGDYLASLGQVGSDERASHILRGGLSQSMLYGGKTVLALAL